MQDTNSIISLKYLLITKRGKAIVSPLRPLSWEIGETVVAECLSWGAGYHPVPCMDCDCGIYGLNKPGSGLSFMIYPYSHCTPFLIYQWGRVILYENGCRSEYAKIIGVADPAIAINGLINYSEEDAIQMVKESYARF